MTGSNFVLRKRNDIRREAAAALLAFSRPSLPPALTINENKGPGRILFVQSMGV